MLDAFRDIRLGCHLFSGSPTPRCHTMAWHFLRLGRKLERRQDLAHSRRDDFMLLPSTTDVGTPYDDIHWTAVLKSVSGFEMPKKFGHLSPADVVNFLVMDEEFPRAVHYCITCASESLHAITGTPMSTFSNRPNS